MYTHRSEKLGMTIVTLHPGEYFATSEDIILATVLGSCVAVALHDSRLRVGGLNHFMLPGTLGKSDFFASDAGKYGMFAMELLLNSLYKLGSRKENLSAKVFGGGSVLHASPIFSRKIPESNIAFAEEFLRIERIPVESSDVGGSEARKILFYPRDSRVLLKRIKGNLMQSVEKKEEEYLEKLRRESRETGTPTLF